MKKLKHNFCFLAGDIHGDSGPLFSNLKKYNFQKDCDIVILGDIGLGFCIFDKNQNRYIKDDDRNMLDYMDNWAKENNSDIWILRGNHDDPDRFFEGYFSSYSNLHVLVDGDIIEDKNNKKYLIVGGAISVDRYARKHGISYWTDEKIQWHIYEKMEDNDIYGIFAHTGPISVLMNLNDQMIYKIMKFKDKAIKKDIEKEKDCINKLIDKFKPQKWYNGHYHINSSFDYLTPNNTPVKVTCVDICNITPLYPIY